MSDRILNPPSDDPVDQTSYAMQAIREAVDLIATHYHDKTEWPGWDDDAQSAVRRAEHLLTMSVPRALEGDE